jgi:hypothetical protein
MRVWDMLTYWCTSALVHDCCSRRRGRSCRRGVAEAAGKVAAGRQRLLRRQRGRQVQLLHVRAADTTREPATQAAVTTAQQHGLCHQLLLQCRLCRTRHAVRPEVLVTHQMLCGADKTPCFHCGQHFEEASANCMYTWYAA